MRVSPAPHLPFFMRQASGWWQCGPAHRDHQPPAVQPEERSLRQWRSVLAAGRPFARAGFCAADWQAWCCEIADSRPWNRHRSRPARPRPDFGIPSDARANRAAPAIQRERPARPLSSARPNRLSSRDRAALNNAGMLATVRRRAIMSMDVSSPQTSLTPNLLHYSGLPTKP